MQDTANAFVETFTLDPQTDGPLSGLTFAAKDIYDIAGHQTGCGSPDWAATHPVAERTAPAAKALLDAGATLIGKSHTDEIAYSLIGANAHYGTPLNSAAPDRVPGGSSSGSVSAVAAGLADIGLGSDTGGSVRMPASFCGVYGIRTTHGRIDLADTMPLAPSFDTAGWFCRDAQTFALAGKAYAMGAPDTLPSIRLLLADDAMAAADPATIAAFAATLDQLQDRFGSAHSMRLSDHPLAEWREVFRINQAAEIWQVHGDWVTKTNPGFGPGVRERFAMAAAITRDEHEKAKADRETISRHVQDLIGPDGILVLPTSPGPAPLLSSDESQRDSFRQTALEFLCPAGLARLPQISIPVGKVDNAPVGLSLVGPQGADGLLLAIASDLAA